MKTTPRELLLSQHQAKAIELDQRWTGAIEPALRGSPANAAPEPMPRHTWLREGLRECLREVLWVARWRWASIAFVWVMILACDRLSGTTPARKMTQDARAPWTSTSFAQTLLLRQQFLSQPEGADWSLPISSTPAPSPGSGEPPSMRVAPKKSTRSGMTSPVHGAMGPVRMARLEGSAAPTRLGPALAPSPSAAC